MERNPRRLNPFAFPPETNQRFLLLVAASVLLAAAIASFFAAQVPVVPISFLEELESLAQRNNLVYGGSVLAYAYLLLIQLCLTGIALIGIASLAFAIYRSHPNRIRRRQRLARIDESKDIALFRTVAQLVQQAGIAPAPDLEIQRSSLRADGQAFGVRSKPIVRLGGGMPLLLRRRPALFRAIIRHELAHIANRDISRTYLTQAIAIAVLIVTVIPLLLYALASLGLGFTARALLMLAGSSADWHSYFTGTIPLVISLIVPIPLITMLVAALRASILRIRELYADWRAALWGSEDGLTEVLTHGAHPSPRTGLFSLHPSPAERLATLHDPARLFKLSPEIPAYAGILSGIAFAGMMPLLTKAPLFIMSMPLLLIMFFQLDGFLAGAMMLLGFLVQTTIVLVPILVIAYLVARSLGLQVERESAAEVAEHHRLKLGGMLRLLIPAAIFSLGMQVGFLLMPTGTLLPAARVVVFQEGLFGIIMAFFRTALWLFANTFLIWLWLAVLRVVSAHVLGSHIGDQPPTGARRWIAFTTTILLWGALLLGLGWQLAIVSLPLPVPVLIALAAVVILGNLALGGISVGWVHLRKRMRQRICPNCETPINQAIVLGSNCLHCGRPLAAWLFV